MTFISKGLAFVSLCCISFIPLQVTGKTATLPAAEIKIHHLFTRLSGTRDDQEKKAVADSITQLLHQALQLPGSFDYPFDQVGKMGKITSADGKIRIYTWNLPWSDGTNTYYGFLQYKSENKKVINVVPLTDRSTDIANPEENILTPERWYGMLIYDIIEKEYNHKVYYTLLGYDNENLFLSRKIIDVLYFNNTHEPVFGKAMFYYRNRTVNRILFEYSAKVQMSLKWNNRLKMIVFDHLSPSKSSYKDNFQYYGPDFTFDAIAFDNGIWQLLENVDARNSNE